MQELGEGQVYLPDVWACHAEYFPDKEAVVCGDERLTWGQFNAGLNRVANALNDQGIGRGERVAVLMNNTVATLLTILGVVKSGASVVPLSGLLQAEQLAVLIDDADAASLIVSADTQPQIETVREGLGKVAAERFFISGGAAAGWRPFTPLVEAASESARGFRGGVEPAEEEGDP